ncbi:hypothetical protein R1flu_023127 [Riccia fluitans]|uniref:Uncharacterized protein n=1 Tax=Riccia fluitans TaxID=41844 RepID=A0ABD1XR53_9MARC
MGEKVTWFVTTLSALLLLLQLCAAQQCGSQAGNAECSSNLCCSQYGYCGSSSDYCGAGCQSGPRDPWLPASLPSGDGSTGEASYYTAPFVPTACYGNDENQFPANQYFAAGGDGEPNIWASGENCGKWFSIQCSGDGCTSSDPISVKIVDRCPNGCFNGRAFDLSDTAFSAMANTDVGHITLQYSGPYDSP